jgi:type II secretory pathway component GspD/PulD (secretin)
MPPAVPAEPGKPAAAGGDASANVAAARVMARDGQPANISISRETFFSVQPISTLTSGESSALIFNQNLEKVEAGITLKITPHIRGDNVTIQIERAEVSEDIRSGASDPQLNSYPIITRRNVSTTVDVGDGKTIVIGGLVQRQTVDMVKRVPGFSRIPVLGHLFQTVERQQQDAEVAIFISPRIVRPSMAQGSPDVMIRRR